MNSATTIRRRRVAGVLIGLGLFGLVIVLRTIAIGTVEHEKFVAKARDEHWTTETLFAQRGTIRDRNGRPLATTVQTWDITAVGQNVRRLEDAANQLAPLLGIQPLEVAALLKDAVDNRKTITLRRGVSYENGEKIAALRLPGITRQSRITRTYPEGNVGSSFLGIVGRDQVGLVGIEGDFNRELMGRHGQAVYERDPVGGPIPLGFSEVTHPIPGRDVVLTIDRYIQGIVEAELDAAMVRHSASGGSIVVMDPWTGEILAMASRPSFNLLDPTSANDLAALRNRVVTDTYEPGSTFKALTVAAAIDAKVVVPTTPVYDGGTFVRNGVTIFNWNRAANGAIDVTEVLKRSSNVGTALVAEMLGPDRFYQYVERFGFGRRTNIELSGEAPGSYRTNRQSDWSQIDLATNSYGQGLTATPLQMIAAHASLINGGKLMRPYVVSAIETVDGVRRFQPTVVRQAISEESSKTMRTMLNASAEQGETNLAIVPGYRVGGKTGTSSIATAFGYTTNLTIASFIGYGPVENPRVVVMVKIDEPKDQPWGSLVASPIFSRIMQKSLVYLKVPPTNARVAAP